MSWLLIFLIVIATVFYAANNECENLNDLSLRRFYNVKRCFRSTLPLLANINAKSFNACVDSARERGGLAINFSPAESRSSGSDYFINCQVLGCPEIINSSTLVNDTNFDYHSLFGDLNALDGTSCIRSAGMFKVVKEKQNYSEAVKKCQDAGGDLAHVANEARTNGISALLKTRLTDWFKIAYVGLDDIAKERHYENPMGESLECSKFRAWAPGHPRNAKKVDDCVTVDSESVWRVVNCSWELPFVCEIFPMAPPKITNYFNVTCASLKDKDKKIECQEQKRKRKNSERRNIGRCN